MAMRKIFANIIRTRLYSERCPRMLYIRSKSKSSGDKDGSNMFDIFEKKSDPNKSDRFKDINLGDAFKMFSLERKFRLDESKLKKEMQRLQKTLHPDQFMDSDEQTQIKSSLLSAEINHFYDVLSNPFKRGKYLLSLITNKDQIEVEEDLERYQVDGEFLARMMEIREIIDDPSSQDLYKLSSDVESELIKMTDELEQDFKNKDMEKIYRGLAKLKFLSNCHHAITDRLGSFSNF